MKLGDIIPLYMAMQDKISFWEKVKMAIEKIISKTVPMDPVHFVLGHYPKGHKFNKVNEC